MLRSITSYKPGGKHTKVRKMFTLLFKTSVKKIATFFGLFVVYL